MRARLLAILGMLGVIFAAATSAAAAPADSTLGKGANSRTAGPVTASPSQPTAATIEICSYDGPRSLAPFATTSEYSRLRTSLLNQANFGPAGIVPVPVAIRPGISMVTAANLAGCDVFFTSVFTEPASLAEAAAVKAAVDAGMVLITDADSGFADQAAVNSVLVAFGGGRSVGPETVCDNSSTGGTIGANATAVTTGPFGDLRGGTFGTSLTPTAVKAASDAAVVSCSADLVRFVIPSGTFTAGSGLVMVGGDPSGFDLFTSPASFLYNPNNEKVYLNAIATAVSQPTNKDQCKNGGWQTFGFKHQGACVSFVATGGRNHRAG